MRKAVVTLVVTAFFVPAVQAQMPLRRPLVRASGEATVSARPDQVSVNASVITQAMTAQEAATQNASQTAALLAGLTKLLGPNADIHTVGYSVTPNYRYPQGGGTPILTGYTATNSIEVTLSVLTMAGVVIDTAVKEGATTVGSLRFSLKDSDPARAQALRLATMNARFHAEAIAGGLGGKVGAVISVQEASAVRIVPLQPDSRVATTTTPIEPGMIEVRANVVLEAEMSE
jgi:hypothetical protein